MPIPKTVILVVEDEPSIRRLFTLALWNTGLSVLEAATGPAAVDLYRQHGREIGAVLLDVRLPGMDGRAVLERLRAFDPTVGCFFATGNGDSALLAELEELRPAGVFAKPFALAEMTEQLWDFVHSG